MDWSEWLALTIGLVVAILSIYAVLDVTVLHDQEEVVIAHHTPAGYQKTVHPLVCSHEWDTIKIVSRIATRRGNGRPCKHCGAIKWDNGDITATRKQLERNG